MKVRELIQDLLLVDQDLNVHVEDPAELDFVIANEWHYLYDYDDPSEDYEGSSEGRRVGIYFTAV